MNNQCVWLRCKHCGNLVKVVFDAGVRMICCGEPMEKLRPNTADASPEKHVPVITRPAGRIADGVQVRIGSAAHPVTPEHFIAWIALVQGPRIQLVTLTPDDPPEALFSAAGPGPLTVYAYCNLHGLWAAEDMGQTD